LDFTDPTAISEGTSATFNPLAEVHLDYSHDTGYLFNPKEPYVTHKTNTFNETATIQQIVAIIIDPQGKGLEDHWAKTASSFMLGAITHLLYKAQRENLPCPGISDVLSELTKPGKKWREIISAWQEYPHLSVEPIYDEEGTLKGFKHNSHPIVQEEAQSLINKPEKEAGSVLSTVVSNLGLFRDPIVAQNSKVSSFKIRQLMYHKEPISLYLIVNPNDQLRLLPLTRLFVTQLVFSLVERMDFKDGRTAENYNHRLLLLLDEFPSLGRMELFEKALGFIGGYGLKAFLVCQGLAQLTKIYGKDEAIRVACHIQIAFAPNEVETSEYLSKLTGQMTILKDDITETTQEGKLFGGRSKQTTLREVQRPLLTADECRRLPASKKDHLGNITEPGDMLIFPAGFAPIKGRQTLYFMNKAMSERARIEPPQKSDILLSETAVETPKEDIRHIA
jgi:type IV secretion system protein VirD4